MKYSPTVITIAAIILVLGTASFIVKDTLIANAQIATYSAQLAADPNNYNAAFRLGLAYFRTKDYTKSVAAYTRATEIRPEVPQAHNNLGNAYRRLQRYEDAEKAYLDTINIAPTYITAYTNLVTLYNIWPKNMGDKTSEIPKLLERGLAATDNNATLIRAMVAYYESIGDTENVEKYKHLTD